MSPWEDEELSIKKFGEDDLDEILEEELFATEADEDEIKKFQVATSKSKSLGTFGDVMKKGYKKPPRRKKA